MNMQPMATIPMATFTPEEAPVVGGGAAGGLHPLVGLIAMGRRYRAKMGYYE